MPQSDLRRPRDGSRLVLLVGSVVGLLVSLVACGHDTQGTNPDPVQVDAVAAPRVGVCRQLSAQDVTAPSNASRTVDCAQQHTAQTYAVGDLPTGLQQADYDSADLAAFAYRTCTSRLGSFLGADESTAMRTLLTWAWFRPTERAWGQGARWYRCDVVAGGDGTPLIALPASAKGLLAGRPDDRWLACASGASVDGAPRTPCTQAHDWRAVTTIKLGERDDPYPGDRVSEVRTRDFCNASVSAWLDYPKDFAYGYTWFHRAEWEAGNRRSVCWARTGT